jgi:hypothetical protein
MTRGKLVMILHPQKMKPFWKMKKWFEFEYDFKWAMMVGLGGLWPRVVRGEG